MNAEFEMFRDSARDLLSRDDPLQRRRLLAQQGKGYSREVWKQIADAGWLSILVPEDAGGLGLSIVEVTAIAEEAGFALLPEPFIASGVQTMALLAALPSYDRINSLLADLMQGERVAALAWQEQSGGLDEAEPVSRYHLIDGEIILNGHKDFVVPGNDVDVYLVTASGEQGSGIFRVPHDSPGLGIQTRHLADGQLQASLSFKDLRLPADNGLGYGPLVSAALNRANDLARIAQAAELYGLARRVLDTTLEYLHTRQQFGQAIGAFQGIQHRMVDAYMLVQLSGCALDAVRLECSEKSAGLTAAASRVKARASEAALHVTRLSVQMHGAMGYTDEADVGHALKRALCLSQWLGGAAAHRLRYLQSRPPAQVLEDSPWVGEFPRDADWESMPEPAFRQMLRAFFKAHYPDHLRHRIGRLHWAEIKDWYFTLSRQGWIAPAWPKEHGGMALPADKLLAYIDEQEKYGVGRPPDQGLTMLGPILMRFGTAQQRERYLPPILSGEHVWAQGYSEPNAGSDLAALRCSAIQEGGVFVVNGQKTWSTLAQDAQFMFMLVRTDNSGKKQYGISFLMVDLRAPGVTVRPISTLSGEQEFCEVFFDNVQVPLDNLVGELHQGWSIAKELLGFERLFSGSTKHSLYALAQLEQTAHATGQSADPAFLPQYAALLLDVEDLGAGYRRFAEIVKRGETLPASVSWLKVWATETHERISMALIDASAEQAVWLDEGRAERLAPLYSAMAAKIFSGTNEVQRNILAKAVLGMPSA